MPIIESCGITGVWWAALMGQLADRWSGGKTGAAPRRKIVGATISHCRRDPENSLHASRGPETFRSAKVATFPLFCFAVLRSLEAVLDAGETPAGFHLPAARPLAKGAFLHHDPADLPRPALGHQGVPCCHHLSPDGKSRCCLAAGCLQRWREMEHHLWPHRIFPLIREGFGSRFCAESDGFLLLKARAQLSG